MKKKPKLPTKIELSRGEVNLILKNFHGLDLELIEQLVACKNKKGPHKIIFEDHMLTYLLNEIEFLTFVVSERQMYELISLANTLEGIDCPIF